MPVLVGIDEAGYGPNLGPLLISASAWQVPDESDNGNLGDIDLYQLLGAVITDEPQPLESNRICLADSKKLYKSGSGLAALEYGVLTALRLCGCDKTAWPDIWETLAGPRGAHRQALPWYDGYCLDLPVDAQTARVARLTKSVHTELQQTGTQLQVLRSIAVFPDEFNRLTEQHGSKGAALTRLTLELLGTVLDQTGDHPTLVVCDKHGGRNRYAAALQAHFPEYLIEIHGEGRAQSVYRWGAAAGRVEVRFQSRGESFLPAALASMTSKYLRELAMRAFNDFWCRRVPNLRATAGYPVDARRFKAEIATAQAKLGIDDQLLWRAR
ncbi:MAG: hypothetical protein OES79_10340 [Planctomycetota bacterium]|nr:hypothetical protein [Planctomycetota bacterium]